MKLSSALLVRNTVYNLLGLGLPAIVALICAPLLIRGMGIDRFGVLNLAWVVIGYFSLFDLGLGRALTQTVAERLGMGQGQDIGRIVRVALLFVSGLGLLGTLVVAALTHLLVREMLRVPEVLEAETVNAFYLLAISIPFVVSTAALRGVLEGYQLFGVTNALRIPMGIFTYVGPLTVLPFSHSLMTVVAVLLIGRVVAWAAHLALCLQQVPLSAPDKFWEWSSLRPMLRFGGWMTVTNIVGPLMVTLDRFLVGALVSVAAVAYYATPSQALMQLLVIPAALVGVMFPAFALTDVQDRERNAVLFARVVKYVFLVLFPIAIVIMTLAYEGLELWLGVDFARNGVSALRWLTVGVVFNGLAFVPLALLQGIGRPDLTAKLHLVELPLYLVVLWWLTSTQGIEGAAMAYTLRVAVDAVLLFCVAARLLVGGAQILRRLAFASAAALITLGLATQLINTVTKTAFLLSVLVVFALIVWFFLLISEERMLILRSLRIASVPRH